MAFRRKKRFSRRKKRFVKRKRATSKTRIGIRL